MSLCLCIFLREELNMQLLSTVHTALLVKSLALTLEQGVAPLCSFSQRKS